jgi:hypothetical protein
MNDPIWALKSEGHVCVKVPYKGYEVSIAMDDSCGAFDYYGRGDIAVFHGGDNVTVTMFGALPERGTLPADAETLKALFHKIDLLEKP